MNKIFKYTVLSLLAVLGLASCSDDANYAPAEAIANAQVYFPNNKFVFNVTDESGVAEIPVARVNDSEDMTVKINVETGSEKVEIPASVEFKAGEKETMMKLNYKDLAYDEKIPLAVSLDAEVATPYGISSFEFEVSRPAPYTFIGKGVVYDNFYFEDFATVDFYQNDLNPNLYRIQSPTISMLKSYGEDISPAASEWLYVQVLKKGNTVMGQPITEDGLVLFYGDGAHDSFNTGYTHPSYSDDICWVFPGIFTKYPTPASWMYNTVTDYKEDGTPGAVQLAPFYYMWNTGGWDKTQNDGMVVIYFPGYEPKDYEVNIKFEGRLIDSKENGSAVFNITLGADIASAKYLMADGKDPMPIYEDILAGADGVQKMNASGQLKIAYKEPGDKTLVVVGYDAEGNEVAAVYTTINIPASGDVETWTALFVGDYYHRTQSYAQSQEGVWSKTQSKLHTGSTLYISNNDETRYKISPWVDNELIFTMGSNNQITVVNQNSGVYEEEYDTYICATDLVTSDKLAEAISEFDDEEGIFWFELLWHDLDDITAAGGAWGFTEDAFLLTGEANAPSHLKMCTPKKAPKFNIKKKFNYLLEKDVKSSLHAPYKNFAKPNVKKTARLKK